jgi:hypothetical protein
VDQGQCHCYEGNGASTTTAWTPGNRNDSKDACALTAMTPSQQGQQCQLDDKQQGQQCKLDNRGGACALTMATTPS